MIFNNNMNNNSEDNIILRYGVWEAITQQQTLDQSFLNSLIIKSNEGLSQDNHENNPAVLPIGAMNDLILSPTYDIDPVVLHQLDLIRGDVFLAPSMDHDDNASLSSQSSSIVSSSPPTQFQPTKDVDLLDIFGTDIMLPTPEAIATTTTTTTTSSSSSLEKKRTRKKSLSDEQQQPVVKRKKKVPQGKNTININATMTTTTTTTAAAAAAAATAWNCQLIEPITDKNDNKTVFQHLTEKSIDWCRYCGTTEGVNWRPGPWGKRTLCNKHGCDYKGYGLASRLPRLDLSLFTHEKLQDRKRPVIQQFCIQCQSPELKKDNLLIVCEGGCSRAYHQQCRAPIITVNPSKEDVRWYCSAACKENRKRNKVVVELPRKHIPLMHLLTKKSN